ncbi:MAG: hypothetical protein KJ063_15030 [Anaerolineae bacterium]|nr:hypothetical protein [Anaerolineae bacterium]
MATFILLATVWIAFSVGVLFFASVASAQFSREEEDPSESPPRRTFRRQPQELPSHPNIGRVPSQQ